jgi:hypothetical protein
MVGLLWTSDQPVAEASTYTGQHNIQTSMPSAGFEPAIPATKRSQTYEYYSIISLVIAIIILGVITNAPCSFSS